MYPSGCRRDLGELHHLAHTLFTELRGRFMVGDSVSVRFDRIDSLADTAIEEEHLVASALLCLQLLHRVTVIPERAHPRHVVTLCDIIDQALTTLLEECRRRGDTEEIRRAHDRICSLSMNLAVAADPSAPDFSEWI
jgi:hypothetical protein